MDAIRLPFLEPILPAGVERGKTIGVLFSPTSEWRMIASATIASRLQANLRAGLISTMRFPHEICADIAKLGVNVEKALETHVLRIADWYTCITGRVPAQLPEDMAASLRITDLGVISAKQWNLGQPEANPDYIEFALFDNLARLFSYNDENSCLKFLNTTLARMKQDMRVTMCGFTTGVLDKKTYADLKSMFDGIIDLKTVETGGTSHSIIRVRSFPDVDHNKGWYALKSRGKTVALAPAPNVHERHHDALAYRRR
jgi:KaiC/GvpD/RAD55 family RecA-like ATPase